MAIQKKENTAGTFAQISKRSLLRIVFGRTMLIFLLLGINFGIVFYFLFALAKDLPILFGSVEAFTAVMLIHLMNTRDNPSVKLSWAFVISTVPLLGAVLYFFVRFDLGHRLNRKFLDYSFQASAPFLPEQKELMESVKKEDKHLHNLAHYLRNHGNFPIYSNSDVTYFPVGEAMFEQMLSQLEQAEKFIFMEYFLVSEGYMWDKILDILKQKAKDGVEVRFLYDGMNAFTNLPYDYPNELKTLGIQCKMFAPVRPFVSTHYNNRDHRKITVIDGHTAFTGGINLEDRYINIRSPYGHWKDTAVMVKGDAVNMDYSQKITATSKAGVSQGPQNVVAGETYLGSIYAKGNGTLSVGLKRGDDFIVEQTLGVPGSEWKKFDISLPAGENSGDADFAIAVANGTVQIDQVTLTTATGQSLGGFRPDILQAVKDLHPTCLRWPGGGYVAQYNWKWGIGPQEDRQRWAHWMWMDYDQNCFGTDEFIKFCREVNTEPVIVVSVHFERPASEREEIIQEALDWLRYCNEPATGEWGSVRAANGHPEPYKVKYWEIDNEMWEMGIEKYESFVRELSVRMREIDPTIKIIACGGFRGEDEGFIMRSGNYFDYLSLHHYEQQGGYATGPKRLGAQYDNYAEIIANSPNPNIKLFISEWNLQSIDWKTGLFAGGFLNECEARDVVAMGAAALFIRRTDMPDWNNAFINFDYKDVFVAPNYQVTELWYDHFSRYRLDYEGDTKEISVVTTLSEDGRDVIVKVVNPTETPYRLTVDGDWKGIASTEYEYYAPGSLTVQNSMAKKDAVALKMFTPSFTEDQVVLEVAPLSAGVLTIEKKF